MIFTQKNKWLELLKCFRICTKFMLYAAKTHGVYFFCVTFTGLNLISSAHKATKRCNFYLNRLYNGWLGHGIWWIFQYSLFCVIFKVYSYCIMKYFKRPNVLVVFLILSFWVCQSGKYHSSSWVLPVQSSWRILWTHLLIGLLLLVRATEGVCDREVLMIIFTRLRCT